MGLYNFQPRFEKPILDGIKTHTIRARRRHPDKPGNTLHLYVGLRHPGARLLMRPTCTRVEDIEILGKFLIVIAGVQLCGDELESLAVRDGFTSHSNMIAFWRGKFPFVGHLIHWRPLDQEVR